LNKNWKQNRDLMRYVGVSAPAGAVQINVAIASLNIRFNLDRQIRHEA